MHVVVILGLAVHYYDFHCSDFQIYGKIDNVNYFNTAIVSNESNVSKLSNDIHASCG